MEHINQAHASLTPQKRPNETDQRQNPSIGKNPKLLKQASLTLHDILNQATAEHTDKPTARTLTIAQLTTATSTYNAIIKLHVHYKYEVRHHDNTTVGQFIVYDDEGNSTNLICFNEPTLTTFYEMINETDYIEVANVRVKPANPTFTLCNASHDIIIGNTTTYKKLEKIQYQPAFQPKTLAETCNTAILGEVLDCVGRIVEDPTVTIGANNLLRASVNITDMTGSIQLIAWGKRMVTCLIASSQLPQKQFAFKRVRYSTFQSAPQLHLNEGAEILTESDHQMFTDLNDHWKNEDQTLEQL